MVDAVALDELRYLPFPPLSGALRFHLISQLYEKTSLIITSKLSHSEWGQVFGDAKMPAALLNRVKLHFDTLKTGNELSHFKQRKGRAQREGKSEKYRTQIDRQGNVQGHPDPRTRPVFPI
ncbi:ATP-binding protein [Janthinobacterium sp. NKUCC06_STL]|nr:ATP-binding protein [Janthinobacterium sp. NKUCC06_STL]